MASKDKAYKFFRAILSPIYKWWYNPKIEGIENIPKNGRFIIVGNHINIMDQCNVIISTKRVIHYLAKKEYFDNKKVAWFFRSSGCIPVDRSRKDDDATSAAIDVLSNDHVLGLFPEGTRNGIKEDRASEIYEKYIDRSLVKFNFFYKKIKKNKTSFINYLEELLNSGIITKDEFINNIYNVEDFLSLLVDEKRITRSDFFDHILLPLKFGAVSLSKKVSAPLIPYAIVGDYKFRSKNLKVVIGKAIEPMDNLEIANIRLEETLKNMIKDIYLNNGK